MPSEKKPPDSVSGLGCRWAVGGSVSPEQVESVPLPVSSPPKGVPGRDLLRFAGTLDPVSVREMREAIEEECEGVDPAPLLGGPSRNTEG